MKEGDGMVKVVVLDDDPDISFLIDTLLSKHGYWVSAWNDPEMAKTGRALWSEADIAVIDYDLRHSNITGPDVVQWARSEAGFTGKSLLITGSPSWEEQAPDDLTTIGVDAVLTKVFHIDEFLDAIRELAGE